jgi:hypothetical protein
MPSKSIQDRIVLVIVAVVAYYLGARSQHHKSAKMNLVFDSDVGKTDPNTGIVFQHRESFPVSRPPLLLAGVGTRKKAVLNIYSLGMYVSAPIQKQIKNLSSPKETCKTISDSKAPKAVKLTFHMSIGPDKIAEAVSQLKGVDEAITQQFHDLVLEGTGGGKMKSGETMSFEWKGPDVISVTIRGKVVGEMKDKSLAQGVLDLYVGSKSVSPSLRKDLGCA